MKNPPLNPIVFIIGFLLPGMGMGIRTLVSYWFGNRRAIEQIAATRSALWLGLLFVLAAGFAREYDGQYLLRQPWHVLIPLPFSIALALIFFVLFRVGMKPGLPFPGFWPAFRPFLALVWLAAPLAYLYAIPFERFLTAPNSIRANLWTLAIVVLWRVFLMVRVARVLFGAGPIGAFFIVMAVGDALVLIALTQLRLPVVDFMGGIRLTDTERVVSGTAFMVGFLAAISAVGWLVGLVITLAPRKMAWQLPPAHSSPQAAVSLPLWLLAVASVLAWAAVLPTTQREQRLRWQAENHFDAGDIDAALALMNSHSQHDFPPHWNPPPRPGYGEDSPPLLDILERLDSYHAPPWVRRLYLDKFLQRHITIRYWSASVQDWSRVQRLLQSLPEGPTLAQTYQKDIERRRMEIDRRALATQPATSPSTQLSGR